MQQVEKEGIAMEKQLEIIKDFIVNYQRFQGKSRRLLKNLDYVVLMGIE